MHAARLKVQLSATPFSDHSAIRTIKLKKNLGTYGIIAGDDTIVQNMYGELKYWHSYFSRDPGWTPSPLLALPHYARRSVRE